MIKLMPDDEKALNEKIAELCHEQWSGWMKYLFDNCYDFDLGILIIPQHFVERWNRQLNTKYKDLSEKEKNSDRKEARKFVQLLKNEGLFLSKHSYKMKEE